MLNKIQDVGQKAGVTEDALRRLWQQWSDTLRKEIWL